MPLDNDCHWQLLVVSSLGRRSGTYLCPVSRRVQPALENTVCERTRIPPSTSAVLQDRSSQKAASWVKDVELGPRYLHIPSCNPGRLRLCMRIAAGPFAWPFPAVILNRFSKSDWDGACHMVFKSRPLYGKCREAATSKSA